MALARAMVAGTLATDPEKRFTPNNAAVTNFVLNVTPAPAVGSRQQAEAFQVRVACWRGLAEAAAQTLQKGDHVLVDGRLMINAFQGQDGVQKKQYEVDASALTKLAGPSQAIVPVTEGGANMQQAPQMAMPQAAPAMQNQGFAPQPGYATPPAAAYNAAPANSGFAPEDFLTEDDIPF